MKYLLPYNCDSNHGCVTESMIVCIVGNGDDMVATTGMIVSSNSSAAKKENENSNRKKQLVFCVSYLWLICEPLSLWKLFEIQYDNDKDYVVLPYMQYFKNCITVYCNW